jgi:hypothetical protein
MDIFMRISRREDFIPGNATRPYKMRFATRTPANGTKRKHGTPSRNSPGSSDVKLSPVGSGVVVDASWRARSVVAVVLMPRGRLLTKSWSITDVKVF